MLKSQLWQLYLHGCQSSIQEAQAQLDAVEASYKEQKAALATQAADVTAKVRTGQTPGLHPGNASSQSLSRSRTRP